MAKVPRIVTLNGLLAVLYVMLGLITFAASVEYGNVTSVIFAPEGVALAFSILFGPKVAPGIVVGQALLSYLSGPSLLGGLGIGAINACEAVLGGYLFRRWGLSCQFSRLRDVGLFAGMIFFILQPISATGGVLVLLLNGMLPFSLSDLVLSAEALPGGQEAFQSLHLVLPVWLHWWMGNSLGQLLVAPLLLAWLTPTRHITTPLSWFELFGLVGALAVMQLVASSDLPANALLFLTLSYALLAWMGLRCGIRIVSIANLLFTILIVGVGLRGTGFMSYLPVAERLFHVSFFVATGVLFSMLLSALLEERRDLIHRLTELASKDELTQLSNRRHFLEQAEHEIDAARRQGTAVSLAIVDLDHFKRVNDTHGHAAGDLILQMFSSRCRSQQRPGDLVGRIGGEEFALLFPRTKLREARQVVQQLLDRVAEQVVSTPDGTEIRITASAGLVASVAPSSLSAMYHEADQALYKAKHAGRNRVWTFGEKTACQADEPPATQQQALDARDNGLTI